MLLSITNASQIIHALTETGKPGTDGTFSVGRTKIAESESTHALHGLNVLIPAAAKSSSLRVTSVI